MKNLSDAEQKLLDALQAARMESQALMDKFEHLQQEKKSLQAKNDALVAQVGGLESVANYFVWVFENFLNNLDCGDEYDMYKSAKKVLNETESESLAEIKATAVEKAVKDLDHRVFCIHGVGDMLCTHTLKNYASQLRQQVKP